MLTPLKAALADRLRRLVRERDGNLAMIFGLAAIPIIIGCGIAIDVGRAYLVRLDLESALDAAAIAVASSPTTLTTAQFQTRLQGYFDANFPTTNTALAIPNSLTVSMTDPTQPQINVTASVNVPTTFLQLIGVPNIAVAASNQVTKGTNALELALVLDNTGSMMCGDNSSGTGSPCTTPAHIAALKTDAQQIVDTLFADSTDPSKLKISVVPYVTSVNVGGAFCSTGTSCTNIATDCSGDFITDNGNTIYNPSTPITPPGATYTGSTSRRSTTISNVSPTPTHVYPGMTVTGNGIPSGTTVSSVSGSQIVISNSATSTNGSDTLTISGIVGYWTQSSNVLTVVYPQLSSLTGVASGVVAVGTGLGVPNPNGNIHYAPATSANVVSTGNNTLTLCKNPTQNAGSASNPVSLTLYQPVVYDATLTATTTNWKGCVVEPTLAGEDSTGIGPDISEPSHGWTPATMNHPWWPFYWTNGGGSSFSAGNNTWYVPGSGTSIVYSEQDGNVIGATNSSYGPNLSCPTPLVRLTTSQTTLDTTMQNMRAWDNSGTAITVGMIWGWRTISPNPPFSDGQPYGTQSLIKAVVLETDGDAEVAGNTQNDTTDFTGYGYISEGNLGSTTSGLYPPYGTPAPGTANAYLQSRLTQVCTNMKAAGIVIYTIGLGDGANNTTLQGCASDGQFYAAPTASDLGTAFQKIATSLNNLRLTK